MLSAQLARNTINVKQMLLLAFILFWCADTLKEIKMTVYCTLFASINIHEVKLLQPITSYQLSEWFCVMHNEALHAAA